MNTQTSSETLLCPLEGKKNTLKSGEVFSLLLQGGKKGVALNTVQNLEEVT